MECGYTPDDLKKHFGKSEDEQHQRKLSKETEKEEELAYKRAVGDMLEQSRLMLRFIAGAFGANAVYFFRNQEYINTIYLTPIEILCTVRPEFRRIAVINMCLQRNMNMPRAIQMKLYDAIRLWNSRKKREHQRPPWGIHMSIPHILALADLDIPAEFKAAQAAAKAKPAAKAHSAGNSSTTSIVVGVMRKTTNTCSSKSSETDASDCKSLCCTGRRQRNGYQLDCGNGFAVRNWQVTTAPAIDYTCCAVAPSDGVEAETETSAVVATGLTGTPLYQLAALNFNCPTGQALRAFNLQPTLVGTTITAKFRCVNVPLLRQVREIDEQLQTVQWDQFKGSWILARIPNVQVRTPIVDIARNKAVAPCGANSSLETWAFGNHGNENQISMVNTCRRIQMDDAGCRSLTVLASAATAATCTVGTEVLKSFEFIPVSNTAPFWNISYVCCPATPPALPTTDAQCSSVLTATRAAGALQPWKFVLTEPDMAIDCQSRMLTGFTLEYPSTSIQVNYTCRRLAVRGAIRNGTWRWTEMGRKETVQIACGKLRREGEIRSGGRRWTEMGRKETVQIACRKVSPGGSDTEGWTEVDGDGKERNRANSLRKALPGGSDTERWTEVGGDGKEGNRANSLRKASPGGSDTEGKRYGRVDGGGRRWEGKRANSLRKTSPGGSDTEGWTEVDGDGKEGNCANSLRKASPGGSDMERWTEVDGDGKKGNRANSLRKTSPGGSNTEGWTEMGRKETVQIACGKLRREGAIRRGGRRWTEMGRKETVQIACGKLRSAGGSDTEWWTEVDGDGKEGNRANSLRKASLGGSDTQGWTEVDGNGKEGNRANSLRKTSPGGSNTEGWTEGDGDGKERNRANSMRKASPGGSDTEPWKEVDGDGGDGKERNRANSMRKASPGGSDTEPWKEVDGDGKK
eukprot:s290_g20.t1